MALSDHVQVSRRFQRAIRIDIDFNDPGALEGFICPQSSAEVLLSMAMQVAETGQAAFTWTGPYGSGKSSLVIALSALLNGNAQMRANAAEVLGAELANKLWSLLPPKKKGWRVLPVVGSRENPIEVIGRALISQGFLSEKDRPSGWSEHRLLRELSAIAFDRPRSHGGLIIFIDEMGKFLEAAALHQSDIFILQQLAEIASHSEKRLILVGILHQSFEEYTHRLSREMRDEWSKIQGRFYDLAVNTAGEEQINLLSHAIVSDHHPERLGRLCQAVASQVKANKPGTADILPEMLESCWPLHPVTACLLGPLSRRRFGQNQRSIFGFLNSAEPNGFQDFLRDATDITLYEPDRLWDYLRTNLESSILASPDGHRWSLAIEAIDRCESFGGDALHIKLCKCIALLDMLKDRSGLFPNFELLKECCSEANPAEIESALKQLTKWSLIIFKRFLNSYAIFAGSDFEVEQAVEEILAEQQEVDFRALKTLAGIHPILAKRHYHLTGALRWFDIDIAPLKTISAITGKHLPPEGASGKFMLVIPTEGETHELAQNLCRTAADSSQHTVVVGLSERSWMIIDLARELLALERIRNERPELAGDPVARREVRARIALTTNQLENELRRALDSAVWYLKEAGTRRLAQPDLNSLASDLVDQEFHKTPHLQNELLNRTKPSSNAIAAQNALLRYMVLNEGVERLGIVGYPPEGGLFASILESTGLYRENDGQWRFVSPLDFAEDNSCLAPLWGAASQYLEANSSRTVPFSEIYDLWKSPPFGVRNGLLPVLAVAFIMSLRNQFAIYRSGIFQAKFKDLDVDYLVKDAGDIQLRWMNLSAESCQLLSSMADLVSSLDPSTTLESLEPIDVARGLISLYEGLEPWTTRTLKISPTAIRIRSILKQANDPNKLLFNQIPSLVENANSDSSTLQAVQHLREGLEELRSVYPRTVNRLRDQMLAELQIPTASAQDLERLRERAKNIQQLTGDFRLEAFITRLSQFTGTVGQMEAIIGLAISKPPREWIDRDLDQAALEISDLAQKFNRSEVYAHIKGRRNKRHAMAVILGNTDHSTPFIHEFDITDDDKKAVNYVTAQLKEVMKRSKQYPKNVIIAALAQVAAETISEESAKEEPGHRR